MITVKKVTLSPANIYALFGAPQIMLSAPPAGYVNTILCITHDMVFATLAYTVATSFQYGKTSATSERIFEETTTLPAVENVNIPVTKFGTERTPFTTVKDVKLTTDAAAAVGDSPIDVYIVYEQKIIS